MAYDLAALARAALAQIQYGADGSRRNAFGNAIGENPAYPDASMVVLPSGEGKYLTADGREVPYPGVGHQEPPAGVVSSTPTQPDPGPAEAPPHGVQPAPGEAPPQQAPASAYGSILQAALPQMSTRTNQVSTALATMPASGFAGSNDFLAQALGLGGQRLRKGRQQRLGLV